MAVQLVIGRAGTGKTRRCLDRVAELLRTDPLGPPVYWIVPRQATFVTERELACHPDLAGFCRAQVLSFETLGEQILAECGGAAVPEVTGLGRQMVLGHLLRRHGEQLKFFRAASRQTGLAARLDATFAEFERCGRTSADLGALLADLERVTGSPAEKSPKRWHNVAPEVQALYDKVYDLKLIYDAYTAYLGQERLDRHRRLEQVLACIDQSTAFRGARVFVDGFTKFTEFELRVLAQLGKVCASVEIALLMDGASPLLENFNKNPEELSLFHEVEETYRRLRATLVGQQVAVDEPIVLNQTPRFAPGLLQTIERDLMKRLPIHRDEPAAELEMIEASDRRREVDAIARRIRELWRTGVRLREMAVLVRDIEAYEKLVKAAFGEHGIQCFIDKRRGVAHHGLLQLVRSALAIAQQDWPHEAVMTLLKTGLADLEAAVEGETPEARRRRADGAIDELENYLLEHRVRGPAAWKADDPWRFRRRLRGEDEPNSYEWVTPQRVDVLRRSLVEKLGPFVAAVTQKNTTVRSIVLAIFEMLERFGVRPALARWMDEANARSLFEQRDEHEQVWAELVDMLDQMVDLLGDEPAELADFAAVLESGLEQFELAITPPTLDQVLVGQVDRSRCGEVKICFILGLNQGEFPRTPHEDTVLSDAERRSLRQRHMEIDPDTQRRLLDENLLAYIAFTRATQRIVVTRASADADGKPLGPSRYWDRLLEIFPSLKSRVRHVSGDPGDALEAIGTPRQLVTTLMGWVRGLRNEAVPSPDGQAMAALYQWLASHPTASDAIDVMRFRSWKALQYTNSAKLSKDVVRSLFGETIHASVTRIEAYAACPFRHFAMHGLALRPRIEEDEVSPVDLGNVLHDVLERVVRGLLDKKHGWEGLVGEEQQKLIATLVQEVGRELREEILLSSARNRYLMGRIERTVRQVLAAQQAAAQRGMFRPLRAELNFGGKDQASMPALDIETPRSRRLKLHGRIDRVDVAAKAAALAVIDYKLRGSKLDLCHVYHGLSLQLLTYLLVLRDHSPIQGQLLSPVAAFYVKLLRKLKDVEHPDEADSPEEMDLAEKPRGVFQENYLSCLDKDAAGRSKVVQAFVNKDGACGDRGRTDVASADEFDALLDHVRQTLGRLADQIMEGQIDIRPYLLNHANPCTYCDFQALCRFDPAMNDYRNLNSLSRQTMLKQLTGEDQP